MALFALSSCWMVQARGASPSREDARKETLRKKARHYFLAATVADAEGRQPEAYELFKKAYSLDPTYDEASYHFGVARMHNNIDTMQSETEMKRSLAMVRQFVDNHPDDVQENLYYGYLAGFADPADAVRIYKRIIELNPNRTTTLLQLAETEIRRSKFDEAIGALNRYEEIEGPNPEVSMRKIQLLFHKADTVGAMHEADRLTELYPTDTRFRLLRGSLAGAIGDTVKMEQDLLESDRLDPDNANVKLALADLSLSRGDSTAYDNYVYQALLSPGLQLEQKVDMLGQYLQQLLRDKGDTSRGDNLFSVLEKEYPHQPELLDLESRYRMATGKKDQGIELMEYATSLDPGNEVYWQQLMAYSLSAGRYDMVEKAFKKASENLTPGTDMKMMYALSLGLDKKYQEAITAYGDIIEPITGNPDPAKLLEEMPKMPKIGLYEADLLKSVYSSASDVYWKWKKEEEAFAACRNALFLDPDDVLTLNNYAYFLAEANKELPKALEMARKVLAAEPENPTYLDTYAWILYKTGEYDEALEKQHEAIEKAKGENGEEIAVAEFYEHLAEMLKAKGDNAGAREAAAKAKEIKEKEND